jgi:uncharacterized membrane protein
MIAKYFVEFIVYAFLGWIYECIYCSIKSGHWDNRGFLYGPVCPIYGFGAILCSITFGNYNLSTSGDTPLWETFAICAVGSAVMEYATSYVLEKIFRAKWWDYSDTPLNIHGRIALPVTAAFGAAGCLIVKFVVPVSESIKAQVHADAAEMFSLLFAMLIAADTALTVQSLVDLTRKLDAFEADINAAIEEKYQAIQGVPAGVQEKQKMFAEKLSERQKYALHTIRKYTAAGTAAAAQRVREYLDQISAKILKDGQDKNGS